MKKILRAIGKFFVDMFWAIAFIELEKAQKKADFKKKYKKQITVYPFGITVTRYIEREDPK